jgi:hypothetical protein
MRMNNLNQFRPRPSRLIAYEVQAFLIANLDGFICGRIEGFYYRQTRFLSKMRLAVGGSAPSSVSANAVDAYSSIAYYVAPSPAGTEAGPQPGGDKAAAKWSGTASSCRSIGLWVGACTSMSTQPTTS